MTPEQSVILKHMASIILKQGFIWASHNDEKYFAAYEFYLRSKNRSSLVKLDRALVDLQPDKILYIAEELSSYIEGFPETEEVFLCAPLLSNKL